MNLRFESTHFSNAGLDLISLNLKNDAQTQPIGLIPVPKDIKNLAKFWEEDLPEHNSLESEYNCWIKKWKRSQGEIPSTASASLQQCDGSSYPNIKAMFGLICTMPVITSEVERTISRFKTIKTYPGSTQKEDRLNGLGMMRIY